MEGKDAMDKDGYRVLPVMEESGYVVVDSYDQASDPREWEDLVYVDWKSSGDTRFAPLASAYGDIARRAAAALAMQRRGYASSFPNIVVEDS